MLKSRILRNYGQVPEVYYHSGDMEYIRSYYDYIHENEPEKVPLARIHLVDDITWNDLSMDRVFKRINLGMSSSGEQYLYYMLRNPAVSADDYTRRKKFIEMMENNPSQRLELQLILSRLGCPRRADLSTPFSPPKHGKRNLIIYLILSLGLLVSLLSIFIFHSMWVFALILALFNVFAREKILKKIQHDFESVNYSVLIINALNKIRKLGFTELNDELNENYKYLDKLKSVLKVGTIVSVSGGELTDFIFSAFLIDLIVYEFLKSTLSKYHSEIFKVNEAVGMTDAAISIASYRESLDGFFCEPEIDFNAEHPAFINISEIVHPCLDEAVPNPVKGKKSMLITGSNASGKSTYLRTAAIVSLFAQSICTCTCESYHASAFRIYSSMAISDDLSGGDSYYIAEIKSLKRIVKASALDKTPMLCVIDEVLRGTNTVERIAASCEILYSIASENVICIAATHDIELCSLMKGYYDMYHFEEKVADGKMTFDYTLKSGAAQTRNAIKLLKIMGFGDDIVANAENRAQTYMSDGVWTL